MMPVQCVKETFSFGEKKTISQKDIDTFKGEITCDKDHPIPNDSNKWGAVRVLACYMEVFNLEIENGQLKKKNQTDWVDFDSLEQDHCAVPTKYWTEKREE
jgi:hypothetical protein